MGRPIKKSFFANLNSPYNDFATGGPTGQGGEGVASIAVGGGVLNTGYTAKPAIVIGAPNLPGGVQAVASARMAVATIVNFTSGAGYTPGQVLTLTGGTGTKGTVTVNTTQVTNLVVGANGGSGYAPNDVITIQGGTGTLATATVGTVDGLGAVLTFSTYTPGSYTVNPGTLTNATTVKTGGTGDDALTVTFQMGVGTASVTTGGNYTALPADVSIVGHSGTGGALFNLTFKVLSVDVITAGSGYQTAPSVADNPDGGATFTATLTATQMNGLAVTAYIIGGNAALAADIMKQEASRRYLVRNAQGKGQCKLVAKANGALAAGEMNLIATDTGGNTYYVTKLTARRATLTRTNPAAGLFATGAVAGWTMGAASLGVVSVANY